MIKQVKGLHFVPSALHKSQPNPSEEHEPVCLVQRGGEWPGGDTLDLAMLARDSDTPSEDTSEPEVVERHRASQSMMALLFQYQQLQLDNKNQIPQIQFQKN